MSVVLVNVYAPPNQPPYLRDVADATANDHAPVLSLYRMLAGSLSQQHRVLGGNYSLIEVEQPVRYHFKDFS